MNPVRFDPDKPLTSDGGSRAEVEDPDSSTEPEPVGAIAERVLDDLAARQREALNRLRRPLTNRPKGNR